MLREYDFTGGMPPITHGIPMTPATQARPHNRFPWRVPSPPRSRPGPYGESGLRPWAPAATATRAAVRQIRADNESGWRDGATTAAQTTMSAGRHGEGCLCDLTTAAQTTRAAGRQSKAYNESGLHDGATAAQASTAAGHHSGADNESGLRNSGADDESGWAVGR
jgi:hypothetical protein